MTTATRYFIYAALVVFFLTLWITGAVRPSFEVLGAILFIGWAYKQIGKYS